LVGAIEEEGKDINAFALLRLDRPHHKKIAVLAQAALSISIWTAA
jgi:hypothetical protein